MRENSYKKILQLYDVGEWWKGKMFWEGMHKAKTTVHLP